MLKPLKKQIHASTGETEARDYKASNNNVYFR